MLGDEAHFGTGCRCAILDLLPDRLDQRDAGNEDSLLVLVQITFGSGLTEEPSLCDKTAADSNANTGSRQDHSSSSGPETDDRAHPIQLRRCCRCTSE